ncbi:MAG: bifunctional folylpolyglutamate synthase/dihydrofolate synthase [Eubacterium sp.]|nr:bifunctional folylpolyglutamate synthase/dihydrofolate synthase [Eubacterium sp.]
MTYEQAMEYIGSFTRSGAPVTDIDRFIMLMKELGDPQDGFKSIHVAGTNGKGSVCEYITCALRASGKRVGRFTSPYITCIEERIQINGKNISKPAFALLCEKVQNAVAATDITGYSQFEILCAIGFLYFSAEQVDYAVIEVGIGGTLDCTNILSPVVTAITSIGLDHTDLLGETVREIASHKAGIIKPTVPCVSAHDQPDEAQQVITEKCSESGSRLVIPDAGRLQLLHMDVSDVFFTYKAQNYHGVMPGRHQLANLICAIEVCELLGLKYSDIYVGIEKARLPARMEYIKTEQATYIVDGAHNPPAMRACAQLLGLSDKPKHGIIGMLGRKNWQAALAELLPSLSGVTFVEDFAEGAVPAHTLAEFAKEYDIHVRTSESLEQALAEAKTDGLTLITGSLYLAGKARSLIIK